MWSEKQSGCLGVRPPGARERAGLFPAPIGKLCLQTVGREAVLAISLIMTLTLGEWESDYGRVAIGNIRRHAKI
jgi:hypothetical protein